MRAQAASLAVVTPVAQGNVLVNVAGAVNFAAMVSAISSYFLTSSLGTDCVSASLPKPVPKSSLGTPMAKLVESSFRSFRVLLYSNCVRRRSGARGTTGVVGQLRRATPSPPAPA